MPDDVQNDESNEIRISKIESYLFCPHAYYLDTIMKQDGLPITGFEAKSFWIKRAFKRLLPEERYVGVDLKPLEQLRGDELARALNNKSAKAFGNSQSGNWKWYVIKNRGKARKREIVWLFDGQWWKAAKEIKLACEAYYSYILKEGVPASDFSGTDVAFYFGDRKWIVRPGAVRSGGIVEAIKTSKATKREVDQDWTVAPKLYAIYALAEKNPIYKLKWNLDSGVHYRRVSLSKGEHHHYDAESAVPMHAALDTVEKVEKHIADREFGPNHENCETCRYNIYLPSSGPDKAPEFTCKQRDPKAKVLKPMEYFKPV
jgi:hypothetical protein